MALKKPYRSAPINNQYQVINNLVQRYRDCVKKSQAIARIHKIFGDVQYDYEPQESFNHNIAKQMVNEEFRRFQSWDL